MSTHAYVPAIDVLYACKGWLEYDKQQIQDRRDALVARWLQDWRPPFEWWGLRPYNRFSPGEQEAIKALKSDGGFGEWSSWDGAAMWGGARRERVTQLKRFAQFLLISQPGAHMNVDVSDINAIAEFQKIPVSD